jgi:hypothetical protein
MIGRTLHVSLAFLTPFACFVFVASAYAQTAEGQGSGGYAATVAQIIRARVPVVNPYADSQTACPAKRVWAYPLATVEMSTCTASCSFRITSEGRAHVVSCRGDTAEHTAILRAAVAGASFPPPSGGKFFASQTVRFNSRGRNPALP